MNHAKIQHFFDLIGQSELEAAFEELKAIIQSEAPLLLLDLTLLRQRYSTAENDLRHNAMTPADHRTQVSTIARDFLYLVQQLPTDSELQPASIDPQGTRGKLLHDIPALLPLNKRTKCVVRIADSERALLEGYQTGQNTVIEDDIAIEKVMAVELLDIEEGKHFEIRALNSSAQQLLSGRASQWVYYVKALTPGEHLLVLRISTVEMIDGVERPNEVIFERAVSVLTSVEPRSADEQRAWQSTKIAVGSAPTVSRKRKTASVGSPSAPAPASTAPTAPPLASPAPATQVDRSAPPVESSAPPKRSLPWRSLAAVMLLLLVAGGWMIGGEMFPTDGGSEPIAGIDEGSDYRDAVASERENVKRGTFLADIPGQYRAPDGRICTITVTSGRDVYMVMEDRVYQMDVESRNILSSKDLNKKFVFTHNGSGEVSGFAPVGNSAAFWEKVG